MIDEQKEFSAEGSGFFETAELEMESREFFVSYNVIFELQISAMAKLLYVYLCKAADSGKAEDSIFQNMANACGLSYVTTTYAIQELKEAGMIHQVSSKLMNPEVYRLVIHSHPKADDFSLQDLQGI